MVHTKPNYTVNTERLWPLFNDNKHKEGLAKGHWLAIKHLLRKEGLL
jgi:hypothetical protein